MFHLKDGLYFRRNPDGSVKILKRLGSRDDAPVLFDMDVSESEWASVITAVSSLGETGDNYRRALEFHTASPVLSAST